jgi:GH15 family glucan-1,4-alpha-glucosidase
MPGHDVGALCHDPRVTTPIEDYAVLSNCRSAALVSRDGSVDWLCLPRYDSGSMFAALLGDESHGAWSLRPADPDARATRRYDGDTFVLVTRWETATGIADVYDAMPIDGGVDSLVRRVVGVSGEVDFVTEVRLRFDYARAVPWVRQMGHGGEHVILAVAGPDAVTIRGPRLIAVDTTHRGRWTTAAGASVDSVLSWGPSWRDAPPVFDVEAALERTREWWAAWADRVQSAGTHAALVTRSLMVLRALTHSETGGIVAAATTSLPEAFGGSRNWDYRYVWLRDAALTLSAYIDHGYLDVAQHWRTWLLRAIAGDPADVQIMYGIAGERDLPERELESLPGYGGAAPVRIGNGAVDQYQADVIGEVMVALEAARDAGVEETTFSWSLQRALLDQLAHEVDEPDLGIWEMRGDPHFFTHSRAMVWAAFDRGIRAVETGGHDGEVDTWRTLRVRRSAHAGHRRPHRRDPHARRLAAALSHDRGRRADGRRASVPRVLFLARRTVRAQWSARRGRHPDAEAHGGGERPGAAVGGVRPHDRTSGGQHPAGALAPGAGGRRRCPGCHGPAPRRLTPA